jgi:hypothetical protein
VVPGSLIDLPRRQPTEFLTASDKKIGCFLLSNPPGTIVGRNTFQYFEMLISGIKHLSASLNLLIYPERVLNRTGHSNNP